MGGSGLLGTLGTVATVGGGLISAYSTYQNGKAQAAAAEATAIQQDNAARQAIEAGERENKLHRRQVAKFQADNTVALAASGVDVNSTASLDILQDTRVQAEEDAFAIRENAVRSANSYGQDAANSRTSARNARSAGRWGAVQTILGTATAVGDRYKYLAPKVR
ncbi:MAG: hypothetical protein ACRC0L_06035 [Angustibacter sp.]